MKFFIIILNLLWATCALGLDSKEPIDKTSRSVIEGTLLQVSKLPPPDGNPYPDCYYTATISINHIVSGQSLPNKLILVLPGFFARQYAPEAKYKQGDKVRATVAPFASMPDKVRQTQQADEIEDVDLDFYYPEKIALVQKFQSITNPVPFAGKHQEVEESVNFQPIDLKARTARQETMRHDLEQINKLLARHGGDWGKWYDTLNDFRAQYKQQYDTKAQRWIGDSFFSAGQIEYDKGYSPEFVKSVIAFKDYLAVRNVDLILVRVPMKGEIVEDLFTPVPADQISNPYLLRMYKELLEADVEIITDIIPRAKDKRFKYPLMYWYQDFSEVHPAEGTSWVIADEFAKRVSRYSRVESMPKQIFTLKVNLKDAPITDGWQSLKWPPGNPKFRTLDNVRYSTVVDDKERPVELKKGLDSPVLVLGSSYIATPSLTQGGTIPHYFAYLTGIVPDLVHRRDADLMMPRIIAREGDDFLRNRSVCLFPFHPWVPHKALAPLPIFDPDKSTKTLLATYSGPTLHDAIEFSPETSTGVLSYSPDGILHIGQANETSYASASIRIKIPEAIAKFSNFILSVEFEGTDFADVLIKYSGQIDSMKRGLTQSNEEVFAFTTKSDYFLVIDITGDKFRITPTKIKCLKFFGVRQPSYYKTKNSTI